MWLKNVLESLNTQVLHFIQNGNAVSVLKQYLNSVLEVLGILRSQIQDVTMVPFQPKIEKSEFKLLIVLTQGLDQTVRSYFLSDHTKLPFEEDSVKYLEVMKSVERNYEHLKNFQCRCYHSVKGLSAHISCRPCCVHNAWCKHKTVRKINRDSLGCPFVGCFEWSNEELLKAPLHFGSNDISSAFYLNVCDNNLTDLPEELAAAEQLQRMDVRFNTITGFPKFLTEFRHLIVLDASYNSINAFPEVLFQMPGLQQLYLDYNHLNRLPDDINRMESLTHLGVSFNFLKAIPASVFEIPNLKFLRLCGNIYLMELPPQVENAKSLETLVAADCSIRVIPHELKYCRKLKHLILAGN